MEELYKNDLNNPDNHNGVITYLEPVILECDVKWALGNITTNILQSSIFFIYFCILQSRGDRIPAELLQILKNDAVKVLHFNMPANLENSAVASELEILSFQSNPKD